MAVLPDKADCTYNHGVICGLKDNCEKCGWNPWVEADRKLKRKCEELRKECENQHEEE